MESIGIKSPKSEIANSFDEAIKALDIIGLPAVIRPGFTLGGKGGGAVSYTHLTLPTILLV